MTWRKNPIKESAQQIRAKDNHYPKRLTCWDKTTVVDRLHQRVDPQNYATCRDRHRQNGFNNFYHKKDT